MSKNIPDKSQIKKTPKSIKKTPEQLQKTPKSIKKTPEQIKTPQSAQELCERLSKLVQQPEWKTETVEQFINLITNSKKQFQLNPQQQEILFNSIIECPPKYRAIVHLAIISKNFCSENGLRTLDGILPKISHSIGNSLDLPDGIKENILKNLGDKQVYQFIQEQVNPQKNQPNSQNSKEDFNKFDFIRNLISLLICEGEKAAILSRLNIILDILSNSSYYQKLTKTELTEESDIKKRVEAIAELFQLVKPAANEAKRLLLYGTHAQILIIQQAEKISELRKGLQAEIQLGKRREDDIQQLNQQQEKLKQQLLEAEKKLEDKHNHLEQERDLYAQLETSSQARISQQREATLNTVRKRIEHELNKLERCLSGSSDNFQENSQIGLRILKKIREQLTE
jgi:hypothetical protein